MANQDEDLTAADVIATGQQAAAETLADELRRTAKESVQQTERLEQESRKRIDDRFAIQLGLQSRSVAASEALAAAMTRIADALERR